MDPTPCITPQLPGRPVHHHPKPQPTTTYIPSDFPLPPRAGTILSPLMVGAFHLLCVLSVSQLSNSPLCAGDLQEGLFSSGVSHSWKGLWRSAINSALVFVKRRNLRRGWQAPARIVKSLFPPHCHIAVLHASRLHNLTGTLPWFGLGFVVVLLIPWF